MYLLDINACIAVINGKPQSVRIRLRKEFDSEVKVVVSPVVSAVLYPGRPSRCSILPFVRCPCFR